MVVLTSVDSNALVTLPASSTRIIEQHPPGKRRVKHSEKTEIIRLYATGLSTREVARQLNVSKTTVLTTLSQAGIQRRPQGSTQNAHP